jgi:hypothetical protein
MLEEAIQVMRLLWEGGTKSHHGKHYRVENARIYTLPDEPPEVLISGFGPRATRLAGRIGDGYCHTAPDAEMLSLFRESGGGDKPVHAGTKVCWGAQDRAPAVAQRAAAGRARPGATHPEALRAGDLARHRGDGGRGAPLRARPREAPPGDPPVHRRRLRRGLRAADRTRAGGFLPVLRAGDPAGAPLIRRATKLETIRTPVSGLRLYARASADPPPEGDPAVVLVHGLIVSGRYMVPTAELLAAHYRVFVPDLPSFGKSEKPPRTLDVAGLSDSLAAWMGEVGLDRAALVGNPFGCQIIVELAVRHPERVERAVLQGPTTDPRARTVLRQMGRLLLDGVREPPSLLPIELFDYLDAGLRRSVRTLRYMLEDRIE